MNLNPPRRPRGWWYPYIFLGAFGVVLAVNLVMITSAIGTFSGLETEQAYLKGIAYNHTLAAAEAQKRLGWVVAAEIEPGSPLSHSTTILASFLDETGRPIDGLTVEARFIRPTAAGHDRQDLLTPQGNGRYSLNASLPLAGIWDLRVDAHRDGQSYQLTRRITVP